MSNKSVKLPSSSPPESEPSQGFPPSGQPVVSLGQHKKIASLSRRFLLCPVFSAGFCSNQTQKKVRPKGNKPFHDISQPRGLTAASEDGSPSQRPEEVMFRENSNHSLFLVISCPTAGSSLEESSLLILSYIFFLWQHMTVFIREHP